MRGLNLCSLITWQKAVHVIVHHSCSKERLVCIVKSSDAWSSLAAAGLVDGTNESAN